MAFVASQMSESQEGDGRVSAGNLGLRSSSSYLHVGEMQLTRLAAPHSLLPSSASTNFVIDRSQSVGERTTRALSAQAVIW